MKLKITSVVLLFIMLSSCKAKVTPQPPVIAPAEVAAKTTKPVAPVEPVIPVDPNEVVTVSAAPNASQGKVLYENNCGKCHRLFAPTEFSKQDWTPILKSMQPKAGLDDAQMADIAGYIHSQLN